MMDIDIAIRHLRRDPVLERLIERYPVPNWTESTDLFTDLVETIIGQQLSNKVADVLLGRFVVLLPRPFEPEALMALGPEAIRAAGISYAKIRSIQEAAEAAVSGALPLTEIPQMSDQEVIDQLVNLRGVGPWTAQMLLIFSLQRPDVFSVGDLGLRTAVCRLYGVERENLAEIEQLSRQWSPYRSLASRYLWLSLENG